MAAKRFLFLGTSGVNEESVADDELALGRLTMSGDIDAGDFYVSGLADATSTGDLLVNQQSGALLEGLDMAGNIDMNPDELETGNKITGLTTGNDPANATTKSYVDNLVTAGVTWREVLVHPNQLSDTEGILSAMAVGFVDQPHTGDTIVLTNGVTTRTYGAGTGGNVQYVIGADVNATYANLAAAILGDASGTWNAYVSTHNPYGGSMVIIIERLYAEFRSFVYGVWTGHQAECQICDLTNELDYSKRATATLPTTKPVAGNFGFANSHASLNPGEMHEVRDNDCLYTWDEATEAWICIAGSARGGTKGKLGVDSDKGLNVSSGILGIDLAGGLEFSSGDLKVKLHGTTPGLELTADGLRTKQGGAKGIIASATGLEVEINGSDTLSVGSGGLKVVGVPALFKINDVAVGANVTKTNLGELTDGSSETALHFHPGAGSSERTECELLAGSGGVALGDPVYVVATNNTVAKAAAVSTLDAKGTVVGIAHAAKGSGNLVHVVMEGVAKDVLVEATPATLYYLGGTSGLATEPPATAAARIVAIGVAINADDMLVAIRDFGKRAA
jgi:hypothetical protein